MSEYPSDWRWAAKTGDFKPRPEERFMTRRQGKSSRRKKTPAAAKPWHTVRAEKVARARQLLQDKGYPSRQVLESVGQLIAKGLKAPK